MMNKVDYENTIEVTVIDEEQYDGGRFPFGYGTLLEDVIDCLEGIMEEIPEEFRDSARCEIDSNSGYEGSHCASIKITYRRPMTEAERAERVAEKALRAAGEVDRVRLNLERAYREAMKHGIFSPASSDTQ